MFPISYTVLRVFLYINVADVYPSLDLTNWDRVSVDGVNIEAAKYNGYLGMIKITDMAITSTDIFHHLYHQYCHRPGHPTLQTICFHCGNHRYISTNGYCASIYIYIYSLYTFYNIKQYRVYIIHTYRMLI